MCERLWVEFVTLPSILVNALLTYIIYIEKQHKDTTMGLAFQSLHL